MEKKARRLGLFVAIAFALALGISKVSAFYVDSGAEGGFFHWLANGARAITTQTLPATDNSLRFMSDANGATAIVVSTNGFASLHTAALCQTETPGRKGEICTQTTSGFLCISTGTTIGAWAIAVTTNSNTLIACP